MPSRSARRCRVVSYGILQTNPLGNGARAGARLLERIEIASVQPTATDCNRSAPTIISDVPGKGIISRLMADGGRSLARRPMSARNCGSPMTWTVRSRPSSGIRWMVIDDETGYLIGPDPEMEHPSAEGAQPGQFLPRHVPDPRQQRTRDCW